MSPRPDRPIFIVGCGRSGTTLLANLLAFHPDLAWFSQYSIRYYHRLPLWAAANRLYRCLPAHRLLGRRLPRPHEGHALWDLARPVANSPGDPPLGRAEALEPDRRTAHRIVAAHLTYMGRSRFFNKNTRNSRRIGYLRAIFPDALFVHLIRDPRPVAASLINVAWWPDLPLWTEAGKTPAQWRERTGQDWVIPAARLWAAEVTAAGEARLTAGPDEYLEIRYEELTADVEGQLARLFNFAGLPPVDRLNRFLGLLSIRNLDHRYRRRLTERQIGLIDKETEPLARELGYRR